jgi:hypothetical protein
MAEWPSSDDWILRTDALPFTRVAMNSSENEAASYLLDYACSRPALEWRYSHRFRVFRPPPSTPVVKRMRAPVKKRSRLPDNPEIHNAVHTSFWRVARQLTTNILIDGNTATYIGPLYLAAVRAEVWTGSRPRLLLGVMDNVLIVGVYDWRIEIRLSAIRFRAAPFVAALRQDGGLIDAAIEHLQSRGRLPRPAVDEIVGEKAWLAGELKKHPPGVSSKAGWAKETAGRSKRKKTAIQSLLSKYDEIWIAAGGRKTSSGLKRRRGSNRQ